jgi:hypothetical protein
MFSASNNFAAIPKGLAGLGNTDWRGIYEPVWVAQWPPGHDAYSDPGKAAKNMGNIRRDYPKIWESLLVNYPWVRDFYGNQEPLPAEELARIKAAKTIEELAKPAPTPVVVIPQNAMTPAANPATAAVTAPASSDNSTNLLVLLGLAAAAWLLS